MSRITRLFNSKNIRKQCCLTAAAVSIGILMIPGALYASEPENGETQAESAAEEQSQDADLDEIFDTIDEDGIKHNEQKVTDDESDDTDTAVVSDIVAVSDTTDYDLTSEKFIIQYGSSDATKVVSNVTNGMYTNDSVSISLGTELSGKLYRDGSELSDPDLLNITEPGGYTMILTSSGGVDAGTFAFCIIGEYATISTYALPEGFSMLQAGVNGTVAEYSSNSVKFTEEGEYYVSYVCDATNKNYSFSTKVDHTAPTLLLTAVYNGAAHTAVSLEDLEEGVTIEVTRNGKSITPGTKLEKPGKYRITLQDPAGNITNYSFTIYMYATFSTYFVVILFVGIFIAMIVYIIVSRKNLRTR